MTRGWGLPVLGEGPLLPPLLPGLPAHGFLWTSLAPPDGQARKGKGLGQVGLLQIRSGGLPQARAPAVTCVIWESCGKSGGVWFQETSLLQLLPAERDLRQVLTESFRRPPRGLVSSRTCFPVLQSSPQHPGGWAQTLEHGVWLSSLPLDPPHSRKAAAAAEGPELPQLAVGCGVSSVHRVQRVSNEWNLFLTQTSSGKGAWKMHLFPFDFKCRR